jgi:hypothetical protein
MARRHIISNFDFLVAFGLGQPLVKMCNRSALRLDGRWFDE